MSEMPPRQLEENRRWGWMMDTEKEEHCVSTGVVWEDADRMELGLDFRNELNLGRKIRKRWTFQVGRNTLPMERSAWALLTPRSASALSIPSGDEGRGRKRLALELGQVQY